MSDEKVKIVLSKESADLLTNLIVSTLTSYNSDYLAIIEQNLEDTKIKLDIILDHFKISEGYITCRECGDMISES